MDRPPLQMRFAAELRMFLPARHRDGTVAVACDGVSTLGHLIESAGVPLTEAGQITVDGAPAGPGYRPAGGEAAAIDAVLRPQPLPSPKFLLDVHLGTLARRMRLAGLDTSYSNDADDPELVELANAQRRVLLTQDRGLLRRRRLWAGAYVRGDQPDEQFRDLLDRFAPPLAPFTRCVACNGELAAVDKADVAAELPPGTRRSYDEFSRCRDCGQVYWRGAHSDHLDQIVAAATADHRRRD